MPRSPSKEPNRYYVALLVVGVAFALTASAYWVETLNATGQLRRYTQPDHPQTAEVRPPAVAARSLWDRWGTRLLAGELVLLIALSVLAMAKDQGRSGNAVAESSSQSG